MTDLTRAVEASFSECADDRLRQLLQSLVRHLHAFVTEVELSETEWERGIAALTATGGITNQARQEFVLWSDALGISMLVDAIAPPSPDGATESTVRGPFWAGHLRGRFRTREDGSDAVFAVKPSLLRRFDRRAGHDPERRRR